LREFVLFVDFFLIIMALYQLKPASRSLLLDGHTTTILPYVWIGSAIVLLVAVSLYHRLLERFQRLHVVYGTCLLFIALLLLFRLWLGFRGEVASLAFYIFVDVLGVVLVEQFWSLTDSIHSTHEGKRWYGLVGTGGLVGGMVGGGAAALIIAYTPLQTPDLLLIAAGIIGMIIALTWLMAYLNLYRTPENEAIPTAPKAGNWRTLTRSRYLVLIAATLLLAQLVSPLVEYQFLGVIEVLYPSREPRTEALSVFFSIMGGVAIAVNLIITPLVLRFLGVLGGLLIQPLVLSASAWGFIFSPGLLSAATMKISDRGLSYSINRAAKELLYIPVDPVLIYEAKAWIDMFGYRIFKVAGSMLILLLTQWTTLLKGTADLSLVVIVGCTAWLLVLLVLYREYQTILHRQPVPVDGE
jgi:AAA family ATP:ADP antiporter